MYYITCIVLMSIMFCMINLKPHHFEPAITLIVFLCEHCSRLRHSLRSRSHWFFVSLTPAFRVCFLTWCGIKEVGHVCLWMQKNNWAQTKRLHFADNIFNDFFIRKHLYFDADFIQFSFHWSNWQMVHWFKYLGLGTDYIYSIFGSCGSLSQWKLCCHWHHYKWCHRWQQSWHHDDLHLSVVVRINGLIGGVSLWKWLLPPGDKCRGWQWN